MKNFIEVTVYETGHKMLVRVSEIKFVEGLKNGTQITTGVAQGDFRQVYLNTKDSFTEVIDKIRQSSN